MILILAIFSVVLLSLTLLLHYQQHFKFHLSICTCSLRPKDERDNYDFFPISFLYYIVFIILLCLLIIVIHITDYYHTHRTLHHDILFSYSVESLSHHENQSLVSLGSVHLSNVTTTEHALFRMILDYILIHSVVLLLVWESLFTFYKYHTTNIIIRNSALTSTHETVRRFLLYAVLFSTVFVFQLHIYYYLWPLLLLSHSIFNLFCALKFSFMLIQRYQRFIESGTRFGGNDDEDLRILNSLYLMRTISSICIVLQSLYLALFTFSYTVRTIYYLPILWSVNASIYALNFVRNRTYFSFKLFRFKQTLQICHIGAGSKTLDTQTNKEGTEGSNTVELVRRAKFSVVAVSTDCARALESHNTKSASLNNKALILLGISCSKTLSDCNPLSAKKLIIRKPEVCVNSRSDVGYTPSGSTPRNKMMRSQTDPYSNVPQPTDLKRNSALRSSDEEELQLPKLPLRRISSPCVPNIKIKIDVTQCVDVGRTSPNSDVPLKHQKSKSDPIGMNDKSVQLAMREVMGSLDLFAKYGFCSRNSVNSLLQLAQYRNKMYLHQPND